LNPSDAGDSFAPTNYVCNSQVFGLPYAFGGPPNPLSLTRIKDGTSNTIFFGERLQYCDGTDILSDGQIRGVFWDWSEPSSQSGNSQYPMFTWYWYQTNQGPLAPPQFTPAKGHCDYTLLNSPHSGAMNICMGDAHVRTLDANIGIATFEAICTPNGGEVLPGDF